MPIEMTGLTGLLREAYDVPNLEIYRNYDQDSYTFYGIDTTGDVWRTTTELQAATLTSEMIIETFHRLTGIYDVQHCVRPSKNWEEHSELQYSKWSETGENKLKFDEEYV